MRIENYQTKSTNISFSELRFKYGFDKYLATQPKNVLDKLDSVKQNLSGTKYYHMEISKDGFYIRQENNERLFLPITIVDAGKSVIIKARQGLSQISKKLKFDSAKIAKEKFEPVRQAKTQIERTAEIVKVLDEYEKLIHVE